MKAAIMHPSKSVGSTYSSVAGGAQLLPAKPTAANVRASCMSSKGIQNNGDNICFVNSAAQALLQLDFPFMQVRAVLLLTGCSSWATSSGLFTPVPSQGMREEYDAAGDKGFDIWDFIERKRGTFPHLWALMENKLQDDPSQVFNSVALDAMEAG
jgi:hypothetical protein